MIVTVIGTVIVTTSAAFEGDEGSEVSTAVVKVLAIQTFSYVCALPTENTIRFMHIQVKD